MVNPIIQKEERSANRGEKSRHKHHKNWGPVYTMAVPKFDGDGCWQQHLQIFNAIEKSNGWADETATLQLFCASEGEGPQCGPADARGGARQPGGTLLLFTGKVGGVQKKLVTRRTGADPATELEILAVRGFGDMGTCARNRMVRDRFITDLRSCGLRRHLDKCSSRYADLGDSGPLPGVESFGTEKGVIPRN